MEIDSATPGDAAALAAIYAHHVAHGTASFETEPPTARDMRMRLEKVLDAGWPWLAARDPDGTLLGYAYAAQFRDRPAYRFACENSIYIAHDHTGKGIGSALLARLIEASREFGFRQMIAVIGGAEPASRALHERFGFAEAGRMRSVGYKHGRWLDTLYMQLALNTPDAA
jgi:phosphinothricin acetyltransferase